MFRCKPKIAKIFMFHGAGGAANGIYPILDMQYLEEQSGLPMHKLGDIFYGASVSTIPFAGLTTPHPDNPEKPLLTAEECLNLYIEHIDGFLPDDHKLHYRHQLRHSVAKALKENGNGTIQNLAGEYITPKEEGILHNRTYMKKALKNVFGNATIGDNMSNIFFPAQTIWPEHKSSPFVHLQNQLFKDDQNPTKKYPDVKKIKIYQAICAATAFATVFNSYRIGKYHFIDSGYVGDPAEIAYAIQQNLKSGLELGGYIYLGTGKEDTAITPQVYAKSGLMEHTFSRFLTNSLPVTEVKASAYKLLTAFLGENNVHIFEKNFSDLDNDNIQNILATSGEAVAEKIAFGLEQIEKNKDKYDRLIDELVENYELKQQIAMNNATFSGRIRNHLNL